MLWPGLVICHELELATTSFFHALITPHFAAAAQQTRVAVVQVLKHGNLGDKKHQQELDDAIAFGDDDATLLE